jgi:endonuclease-3
VEIQRKVYFSKKRKIIKAQKIPDRKQIDWEKAVQPLLKKYKNKKHPLQYRNLYELLVVVIISAQGTDKIINEMSAKLFKAYPTLESLSRTSVDDLNQYIGKVRSFFKKADWIIRIAKEFKDEKNIPLTMEGLVKLPGIGRKSANVILREAKKKPEGIIVDIHVLRVAPRIGIAKGEDANDMEKQLMKKLPEKDWDVGMAMSFLGREICRPTDPEHEMCVMKGVCGYYAKVKKVAEKKLR